MAERLVSDGAPQGGLDVEQVVRHRLVETGTQLTIRFLASDPDEAVDRAASEPALVHELKELLADELARQSARAPDGTERAGAGTLELLKAIGYADGGGEDE